MADMGEVTPVEGAEGMPLAVVVAIVNYRSAALVIEGLPGLVDQLRAFHDGHVIIIDNASPDGDADRLAGFLEGFGGRDRVRLVRSPVNGGFAAGNNRAFEAAGDLPWQPDAVLLLNPDAELQPGALATMAAVLRDRPRAGVVGAALENEDGSVRAGAFRFPTLMGEFVRDSGIGPLQRLWPSTARVKGDDPVCVDWVTGAAMLIRCAMLKAIGPMDEGYFLYFEETDFQRRAQRAGWEIWHAPRARVRHQAGSSTGIVGGQAKAGRMPAYWFASWLRYFTKNHGVVYARLTALMRLLGMAVGDVVRLLRRRPTRRAEGFAMDFARFCLLAPFGAQRSR